ncbi:MAG: hypothetical protein JRJ87_27190, partial [Deltaproteobacteria bacterium]|nr:hypothetical protein [Deltaproteobacteria bacterium]
ETRPADRRGVRGNKNASDDRGLDFGADQLSLEHCNRVYRTARDTDWIEAEFKRCRGSQFDPDVTDVFLAEFRAGNLIVESLRT